MTRGRVGRALAPLAALAALVALTLLAFAGCIPKPARSAHGEPFAPSRAPDGSTEPGERPASDDAAQRDDDDTDDDDTASASSSTGGQDDEDGDDEEPDDAFDEDETRADAVHPTHPFAALGDAELERRLTESPESLGSMSIGKPSAGMLFNAVPMPSGDAWSVVSSAQSWATDETVQFLQTAIRAVARTFPDTPRLAVGDISARGGGYIKPHLSHQAGRDVDLGYYYVDGEHWYARATEKNLDLRRSWALVRALVSSTDVELILIDHSVQALLRAEAEQEGEEHAWVEALFRGANGIPPMIRHAPGHATHLHVRFYNPVAQETGRRLYAALVRQHKIVVGPAFATHVAKKGDTLISLAKRFGSTVRAIRRANGLKTSKIQAKKSYRIPQAGRAPPTFSPRPVAIPPRRVPPAKGRITTEKTPASAARAASKPASAL